MGWSSRTYVLEVLIKTRSSLSHGVGNFQFGCLERINPALKNMTPRFFFLWLSVFYFIS